MVFSLLSLSLSLPFSLSFSLSLNHAAKSIIRTFRHKKAHAELGSFEVIVRKWLPPPPPTPPLFLFSVRKIEWRKSLIFMLLVGLRSNFYCCLTELTFTVLYVHAFRLHYSIILGGKQFHSLSLGLLQITSAIHQTGICSAGVCVCVATSRDHADQHVTRCCHPPSKSRQRERERGCKTRV